MRVVSLAPSATQTVHALGLEDTLVATTEHTAEHPDVGGWLTPDVDLVASYDPDLIILTDALQDSIDLGTLEADIIHVDPRTLEEVYESIHVIGEAITGDRTSSTKLVDWMIGAFDEIKQSTPSERSQRPTVYCEEWSTPPMAAGNWVPEIVEMAGGEYPFVEAGDRSKKVPIETIEAASPEYVVLHICGDDAETEPESVAKRGWDIPAIESNDIYVVDDSLLNQPGPRLVDGAFELADIFHPYEGERSKPDWHPSAH